MFPRKMREKLNKPDFIADKRFSGHEHLGYASLRHLVITKIDTPRPDRQDYLDILIDNYPPENSSR